MKLEKHSELRGKHAIFAPSSSSWLRYDIEKMVEKVHSNYRVVLGTELHDFSAMEILMRHRFTSAKQVHNSIESFIFQKYFDEYEFDASPYAKKLLRELGFLPPEVFETVKTYINDCTKYRMSPESPLKYSDIFHGTTDCISSENGILRIHDLKTGSTPTHIEQLEIYAALYCLEYKVKPSSFSSIDLRIYQNGEVLCHNPESDDILAIMNFIKYSNSELNKIFFGGV